MSEFDFESPGLRELLMRYQLSLPAKRLEIESAQPRALAGDEAATVTIKRCAHKLAGSAASYGFEDISLAAARLDDWLIAGAHGDEMPGQSRIQLASLIQALIIALSKAEQQ